MNILELRLAAALLIEVDELVDELNASKEARKNGWGPLMGFDLPWLAEQLDSLADRMEGK